MRTSRRFEALVAFVFQLFWGGGAVGCKEQHEDCASIAPGTPVTDVPAIGGPAFLSVYCAPLSGPQRRLFGALSAASIRWRRQGLQLPGIRHH